MESLTVHMNPLSGIISPALSAVVNFRGWNDFTAAPPGNADVSQPHSSPLTFTISASYRSTTSTTAHSIILSFTALEEESRALKQREGRKKLIFSYKDKIQCFALWLRFRILFPASEIKRRELSVFRGWSKCTRHAMPWNHRGVSDSRDFIRFFSFPNYFLSISLKPCIKPLTWCDFKTGDGGVPFEMCSTIKERTSRNFRVFFVEKIVDYFLIL